MEFLRVKKSGEAFSGPEELLRGIETRYGVRLTVHDLYGKLRRPDGGPLLPGRHLHPHECCFRGRYQLPFWNARCVEECFRKTEELLDREPVPHWKTCWKHLTELVVPVCRKGSRQLTLFAGVFRPSGFDPDSLPEHFPDWFRSRYAELPEADEKRITELEELLRVVGNGLLEECEARPPVPVSDRRLLLILEFIRRHAHEPVSLKELGAELSLSPSRARHLVRELCGRSFLELLEEERMLRAKALLLGTDRKLADVSESVGYPNEYYFNRVFARHYGISPGRFRKNDGNDSYSKCKLTDD